MVNLYYKQNSPCSTHALVRLFRFVGIVVVLVCLLCLCCCVSVKVLFWPRDFIVILFGFRFSAGALGHFPFFKIQFNAL